MHLFQQDEISCMQFISILRTGAVVWLEVCAACDALLQHAATPGRNCFYTRGLAQQQQGRERAGAVRI